MPLSFARTVLPPLTPASGTLSKPVAATRLAWNFAANVAQFAVLMAIGVWYTPYLIVHLGVSGYGLIPLVLQLTTWLRVFTTGLSAGLGRFMILAVAQHDEAAANRVFNTALFTTAAVIGVAVASWIAFDPAGLVRSPAALEHEATLLVAMALVAFLLLSIAVPFESAFFCANRLDVASMLSIAVACARVGVVVALFHVSTPGLWQVGAGLIAAAALSLGGAALLSKQLMPFLRVRARDWDRKTLRGLADTGAWSSLNHVGTVLFLGIDLLVVNRLFGAEATGLYAACLQWPTLIRGVASTLAPVFAPPIAGLYATGLEEGLVGFCARSVRVMALLVALPVAVVSALSRPLLHLWLGPTFADLAPLMTLMTVHLSVNLAFLPLHQVAVVTGHVRVPGLVSTGVGAANLAGALLLAGPGGLGLYGVALAGALTLTFKNLIFTPLYTARVLQLPPGIFLRSAIPGLVTTALLGAFLTAVTFIWTVASWPALIAAAAVATAVYAAVAWQGLSESERTFMRGFAGRWGSANVQETVA
jgi:membrane protein EpsK